MCIHFPNPIISDLIDIFYVLILQVDFDWLTDNTGAYRTLPSSCNLGYLVLIVLCMIVALILNENVGNQRWLQGSFTYVFSVLVVLVGVDFDQLTGKSGV